MTLSNTVGYYINRSGSSTFGEPNLSVGLVYGKPIVDEFQPHGTVRPVERAFELSRFSALDKQGIIYVAHFDPDEMVLGGNPHGVDVPATPELHRVFDEYLPEWKRERDRYFEESDVAFERGMERAGLTSEHKDKIIAEDEANGTNRYMTEFFATVVEYIDKIPKRPLVRVEGIDDILDSANVRLLLER